jgi:hypothetical protein
MALNPFFLQGSSGEQNLVQELINEQLKIYGIEVLYIPRKFVRKQTIIEEIQSSKFDDNFLLEAYLNNYEGYSGAGDIMTKFGVSVRDEVSLVISRERFEDFISPFLEGVDDSEIEVYDRPREGDLVYFPLGKRLFEVKFVEHEKPFYQLGKNYVYELQCELFEYEDEVFDTSIDEVDKVLDDQGYIVDLTMFSSGTRATATATVGTGFIQSITLNNDGSGFTSTPTVAITTAPSGGTDAQAVAITTTRNNITSIKEIRLVHAGAGYTVAPTITITGGGGTGAAATCGIQTDKKGVIKIVVTNGGAGYSTAPNVTFTLPSLSPQLPASAIATVSAAGTISAINITDAGAGFFSAPTVTVATAATTGIGTYWFNEVVTGSRSGATARVKNWDTDTNILRVGITSGGFYPGEIITGARSGAAYEINVSAANTVTDKYRQNEEFEVQADRILDFTESNPFGTY